MSVEVMAWSSFIAGLAAFATVKALSWMPMSIRLMTWLLGVSFMSFAMIYLVASYDPKMTQQATEMAYWIMLSIRVAVPILAVYVVFKWGSKPVMAATVTSLLASACGNHANGNQRIAYLMMGMLIAVVTLILLESIGSMSIMPTSEYGNASDNTPVIG